MRAATRISTLVTLLRALKPPFDVTRLSCRDGNWAEFDRMPYDAQQGVWYPEYPHAILLAWLLLGTTNAYTPWELHHAVYLEEAVSQGSYLTCPLCISGISGYVPAALAMQLSGQRRKDPTP